MLKYKTEKNSDQILDMYNNVYYNVIFVLLVADETFGEIFCTTGRSQPRKIEIKRRIFSPFEHSLKVFMILVYLSISPPTHINVLGCSCNRNILIMLTMAFSVLYMKCVTSTVLLQGNSKEFHYFGTPGKIVCSDE